MVSVLEARPTMLPPEELLTDVLPTERLTATGMPVPALRTELRQHRRPAQRRHAWSPPGRRPSAPSALAVWIGHPLAYAAAFVLMGPAFARFAILGHEAAHKLLFTNKRWNDAVGPLGASPTRRSCRSTRYRRGHFAHHKDEFGPNEPDMNLYNGYPITEASFRRKMWRDARGTLGLEEPQGPAAVAQEPARPARSRSASSSMQVPLIVGGHRRRALVAVPAAVARAVADVVARDQPPALDRRARRHGALEGPPPDDAPRAPGWLARFWMVPLNTGWHLAHHVDMGVPWRNLPRLHAELEAAGYVTPELTYPSYRALWRTSAPDRRAPADVCAALHVRDRTVLADVVRYGSTTTVSPWRMVPGSRTQA